MRHARSRSWGFVRCTARIAGCAAGCSSAARRRSPTGRSATRATEAYRAATSRRWRSTRRPRQRGARRISPRGLRRAPTCSASRWPRRPACHRMSGMTKRMTLLGAIVGVAVACATAPAPAPAPQSPARSAAADTLAHPAWSRRAVIYEVNVRQYTAEGTLRALLPHLPRLKSLGVDVIWLMPVQPIGRKNRKGTMGSYYSISDYTAINPEFGTMADFDTLVAAAHREGLKVLLDWVPNHT